MLCGTPNPAENPPCTSPCALCKGSHKTYSKECELKFYKSEKTTAPPKRESGQVRVSSHSRSRSRPSRGGSRTQNPAAATDRQPSCKPSKKPPAACPSKTLDLSNETKWPLRPKDENLQLKTEIEFLKMTIRNMERRPTEPAARPHQQPALGDVYQQSIQELLAYREETQRHNAQILEL